MCVYFVFPGPCSEKRPSLKDLMEDVGSVIPHKWQEVGIQLCLSSSQLEEIRANNSDVNARITAVFVKWECTTCSEYTWNTVYKALMSNHVNEKNLAATVKSKYL